jgi:hypothetical protein
MFNEAEMQVVEVEISSDMVDELIRRAKTMGLMAGEYAGCVVGQQLESNAVLEG